MKLYITYDYYGEVHRKECKNFEAVENEFEILRDEGFLPVVHIVATKNEKGMIPDYFTVEHEDETFLHATYKDE